ncbi:uncharacterized protein LOC124146410 isoform X1 [Haliotis rufescens]|uniref:uncharacterized protein LOC124146410 isoform X1 n=1 Tax=Haliotis rufescens TaxID=6454 RepID=UPI001EB09F88|nr:uncharacterized protein LOC124146410 isoform X1 [Haliotis rufescens]XP_046372640.1 uncharacterized protein LOC124146410 isoform X1 [Haliotis rufescens]
MVGLQPTSAEAAMSGSEFTLETGLSRKDSLSCTSAGEQEDGGHASQSSQTSPPQPKSAAKSNLSIKQKNTKSGKKAYVSKALVLSGSEDGQAISVKPSTRSSPVTSSPPSPLEIQSEKTDNLQMITCFESMSSENGNAAMFVNSDPRIHELDGDVCNYRLWLIKMPAEMPLLALPKHITLDGIQDFAVEKKRYELRSFDDDNLEHDHVSLVQQDVNHLTEGPKFQGQIHILKKPRDVLKAVTAAKIPHNTVPFPSGLKIRFKPFGADEPQAKEPKTSKRNIQKGNDDLFMEEGVSQRKKRGSADVGTPPKKKKKKKNKRH